VIWCAGTLGVILALGGLVLVAYGIYGVELYRGDGSPNLEGSVMVAAAMITVVIGSMAALFGFWLVFLAWMLARHGPWAWSCALVSLVLFGLALIPYVWVSGSLPAAVLFLMAGVGCGFLVEPDSRRFLRAR
jgi:hypothetical protein